MNEFEQNQQTEQTEATPLPTPPAASMPPPQAPTKVRRVGTFTMGLALIGTGVLIAIALVLPSFDLSWALRLCPALLILLGSEVLFYSFQKSDTKIKYDFLSMFVCFILVVTSLCLAMVPTLLRYYGPERELAQNRLSRELDDACYDLLGTDKSVLDCSNYLYFSGMEFDKKATLETLNSDPEATYTSIHVSLAGSYAKGDTAAFAEDAARIVGKLSAGDYRVDRINLSWNLATEQLEHSMQLEISGRFMENKTAAELAPLVQENYYDRAAEEAEEQASRYEEAHDIGYEEGYQAALSENATQDTPDEQPAPSGSETVS